MSILNEIFFLQMLKSFVAKELIIFFAGWVPRDKFGLMIVFLKIHQYLIKINTSL